MRSPIEKVLLLCTFLFVFMCKESTCVSLTPEYILEEGTNGNCDQIIENEASAILRSQVGAGLFGGLNSYGSNQDCAVTFQANNGGKVLVQFPFFDLPPKDGNTCTDKIVITEKGTGSTDVTEICTEQDFISVTEKLEVKFISDSTTEKKGVVVLVTSFHDGVCLESEFKCDTTRCISSDLKCDGHSHCIDEADENKELAGCSIIDEVINSVTVLGKYGILAIVVVVSGVLLTVFIAIILWKYLKKDRKCCECSDSDDDDDCGKYESQFTSTSWKHSQTERGHAKKNLKVGSSEKGSGHKFVKEDHKSTKKIKVRGKTDPDIEW